MERADKAKTPPAGGCDEPDMREIQTLYGELLEACVTSDVQTVDALVALTLVLRDLALRYHGPSSARDKSVNALDHSFIMDAPTWPTGSLH